MRFKTYPLFKIWKYLSKRRKYQLMINFLIMIVSGLSELLVINSAVPFLASFTSPGLLSGYRITKIISKVFGISINSEVLLPFIIFFAISVLISSFLRLLSIFITSKLTALIGNDLSSKIFSRIIYQPYEYHLNTSSSKIITNCTLFVDNTTSSILSFLNLIYSLLLTAIISVGMFFINPNLTILSLFIFTFVYLLIAKNFQELIKNNSKKRTLADQSLIKSLQEGLGSIRNILLESNQKLYINNFSDFDRRKRLINASNYFITESPRFFIEALGLIFIALICIFSIKNLEDPSSILITLGAFTLGIQRLLPTLQRVYTYWGLIRQYSSDVDKTIEILEINVQANRYKKITPLKFKDSIRFDSVFFAYKKNKTIISNLNLKIVKGQRIGIIGRTGSGKTTVSDLLMGLLKPTKGRILVDDKDIHDANLPNRLYKWRMAIAHVPQNIFITEASFFENIAFGINKKFISLKKVKECAKKAQIDEFIESTKNGYLTTVGERGIRLSGGQLQRIAIARALYRNSEVLIFDEATSALDNNTEIELMKAINELSKELTIISIAHRYSTLKKYDRILILEKGYLRDFDKNLIT